MRTETRRPAAECHAGLEDDAAVTDALRTVADSSENAEVRTGASRVRGRSG